ncbi:MAG: decarboxylating 6-phosphogluconate dehydrogenase [Candidatus Kerfeldbacteria bacterium]|nr:decarboxylating 6-phosphogluconate dehydrogenase [Candidatus Kerfeldbacteria bacterium]
MARKLIPALRHMFTSKSLPERVTVVSTSRLAMNDGAFRLHVREALLKSGNAQAVDEQFLNLFQYLPGDFSSPEFYQALKVKLDQVDIDWGVCTNKLFYFAVPPNAYAVLFQGLARVRLNEPCSSATGWTRILVEKPYGSTLPEAETINALLEKHFRPEQVYRIDHYLGKQAVQNILSFRFSNTFLEPSWSREFVERVEVRIHEKITIEGRGAFYDQVGALLDVGQNHALQLLALVAMEHPSSLNANVIWQKRTEILEALRPVTDSAAQTFRAQYEGYREQPGVATDSTTETFFRVTTTLDHPRWRGVPIIIEGGKNLPADDKQVIVTFKHPTPCLCPPGQHYQTKAHFRLAPNPGVAIQFWSRKSGSTTELQERWLTFDYPADEQQRYLAEYAQLLSEAIMGNQLLFISGREALASWRFVDPIRQAWKTMGRPQTYAPQTLPNTPTVPAKEKVQTIGMVGLGKMGLNLSLRLAEKRWSVAGFDPQAKSVQGVSVVDSLSSLVEQLPSPKVVWLMVPHQVVDQTLFGKVGLASLLHKGDIVIDGGNSYYRDSIRRAKKLSIKGIKFIDVGVSGGPGGARYGPSLMVGGQRQDVEQVEHLFLDLALSDGYQFFPGHGAGHFVKMVHNGIEYGMMQAVAEGFTILKKSSFKLDLAKVAEVYNHGSVIESRLMEWLRRGLVLHGPDFKGVSGTVAHTGEGEWTVKTAKALKVQTKIIEASLQFRKLSAKKPSYTAKILSALREQFGGHASR